MDNENYEIDFENRESEESTASIQKNEAKSSFKKTSRKKKSVKNTIPESENAPKEAEAPIEESITEDAEPREELIADSDFDSLIVDEDAVILSEEGEDKKAKAGFEEFLSDYKSIIGKTLTAAKSALSGSKDETEEKEEESIYGDEEDAQLTLDISDPIPAPANEEAEEDEEEPPYDPKKPRIIDSVFDFVELFVFTLAAVLIITGFLFKHTTVDGESMVGTLANGEHLIISDVFYTPKRGDIIVFQDLELTDGKPWVKRVIGIAGDVVTIDEDGHVLVNGTPPPEEEYAYFDSSRNYDLGAMTITVPEGEVFVMGDNRYNSKDSRSVGTIKVDSILGKVLLRFYPFDKFGAVD